MEDERLIRQNSGLSELISEAESAYGEGDPMSGGMSRGDSAASDGLSELMGELESAVGGVDGGPGGWACSVCTFLNHEALGECEMCGSPRA